MCPAPAAITQEVQAVLDNPNGVVDAAAIGRRAPRDRGDKRRLPLQI
jgi:hypothetical protein